MNIIDWIFLPMFCRKTPSSGPALHNLALPPALFKAFSRSQGWWSGVLARFEHYSRGDHSPQMVDSNLKALWKSQLPFVKWAIPYKICFKVCKSYFIFPCMWLSPCDTYVCYMCPKISLSKPKKMLLIWCLLTWNLNKPSLSPTSYFQLQ